MTALPEFTSVFPIEIYEQVIDHVHYDYSPYWATKDEFHQGARLVTKTLCNCALTCAGWLPRSRVNIYRRLRLQHTEYKTLTLLVRALDSTPALQQLVEILEVIATVPPVEDVPPPRSIWHSWPVMLAGRLPRLRCLGLYTQHHLGLPTPSLRTLTAFSTVTELSLHWSGGPEYSCREALKLMAAFPNVFRLTLRGSLRLPRRLLPSQTASLSGVTYIHLDDIDSSPHATRSDLSCQLLNINAPSVQTLIWRGNPESLLWGLPVDRTHAWTSLASRGFGSTPALPFSKLRTIHLMLNIDSYWQGLEHVAAWLEWARIPCLQNIVLSRRVSVEESKTFPDHLADLLQAGASSRLDSALHSLSTLHSLVLLFPVSPGRLRFRRDDESVQFLGLARSLREEECQEVVAACAGRVYEGLPLLAGAGKVKVILHREDENNGGKWFCQTARGKLHSSTQAPPELKGVNIRRSWP